ncbi:MAG: pseudouridine synthase [Bacteroidales bacterium]|nr:pseudouridine synthase [Bacteroidales bacterium]
MKRNDNVHNWDRQSRDENLRRGFRSNGGERKDSKRDSFRKDARKPFRKSEDGFREKRNSDGERRSFDRKERNFDRKERDFNRTSKTNYREERFAFDESRPDGRKRRTRIPRVNKDLDRTEIKKRNFAKPKPENIGKTRLNKFIANAGICSRREADVLISTGVITVNGNIITEMGYKVEPGDVVKYNGRELKDEKKVYILLNKPKGFITTADDPQQRHTVMELIDDACPQRVYPVGRLDRNTTGLLLFTNDGDLTKKLTHPSFGAQKVYNVELDHPVSIRDMDMLLDGVELEDGLQKVDKIDYSNNYPIDKRKVGVSIHSGKNRIVRRLFESLGYEVKKLDRVYFAGLTKKNLLRGKYRFLTEQEVAFLKMDKN